MYKRQVQYYTKVWLNGAYIGDHEGSYGKFQFDVTDQLRHGEQNLLALRLYVPVSYTHLDVYKRQTVTL